MYVSCIYSVLICICGAYYLNICGVLLCICCEWLSIWRIILVYGCVFIVSYCEYVVCLLRIMVYLV